MFYGLIHKILICVRINDFPSAYCHTTLEFRQKNDVIINALETLSKNDHLGLPDEM